jgi:6-aminohexanoate-oligomer endohydrolase
LDAPTEGGTKGQARTYPGSRVLKFDFPSFKVGVAEYEEGPTGCTVFHFPEGAATAIDVRGGNVGKIGDYEFNHAICLAGGSLPGPEAAAGVAAELWDRGGRSLEDMPLVSGAIVFDYDVRANRFHLDMALGRAALSAACEGVFPLGARGAGRSASCGGVLSPGRGEPSGRTSRCAIRGRGAPDFPVRAQGGRGWRARASTAAAASGQKAVPLPYSFPGFMR